MDDQETAPLGLVPFVIEREDKMVTAFLADAVDDESSVFLPYLVEHGFTIMHTIHKRPAALPHWTAQVDMAARTILIEGQGVGIFWTGSVIAFPERFEYAIKAYPWCWLYVSGPPVADDLTGPRLWDRLEENSALGGMVAARIRIELAPARF